MIPIIYSFDSKTLEPVVFFLAQDPLVVHPGLCTCEVAFVVDTDWLERQMMKPTRSPLEGPDPGLAGNLEQAYRLLRGGSWILRDPLAIGLRHGGLPWFCNAEVGSAHPSRQILEGSTHDGSNRAGVTLKVIVDLCVVPIGVGVHLAHYIAACEKVLTEAGLKIQLHPNGTAIEGEWEPVFAAIEACHQAVHAMGCPRIYTTVKVNTRTDKDQTLEDKVASVQALL